MAVTGVPTLLADSRERGFHDKDGIRGYEEVWRVNVTDPTDGAPTAGSAPGLPRLFLTPYRDDAGAYPVDIRPERVKNTRTAWDVVVVYSNHIDQDEQEDNPLAQYPSVSWSTVKTKRFMIQDLDGKAIVNTSGERIGPIEISRSILSLVITRNEPQFNLLARLLVNHVNSTGYSGGPPGTVMLDDISASKRRKSQFTYWPTTYRFLFDEFGWQPRLLNAGLMEFLGYQPSGDDPSPGRRHITDGLGNLISSPVPLHINANGDSVELELNNPGVRYPYGIDDIMYLDFKGYGEVDFNILGLPV